MANFRKAQKEDLDTVFKLGQSVTFDPERSSNDGFLLIPPKLSELEEWVNTLKYFYIAEENEAIGYLTGFERSHMTAYATFLRKMDNFGINNFLYIDNLVIDKMHRGKGIGSAFYNFIFDRAKQDGFSHIISTIALTPRRNTRSLIFHKKHGFIDVDSDRLNTVHTFSLLVKKLS